MVETLDDDRGRRPRSPSDIEEETAVDEDAEEDPQLQDMDASPPHRSAQEPKAPPPSVRKAGGKKRRPLSLKQRTAIQEKLSHLAQLEPHPFIPNQSDFDVAKHERVLRSLGLWEFANLQLDREIRKDLLIELIAHRDTSAKRSTVNEARIALSRADLARALKIPNRKAVPLEEVEESDRGVFAETSTTAALVKFLLNWVVLSGEVGIIPAEAQAAIESIQNGNTLKVDWAGLLWIMVEKELSEAPKSGVCYYASHLQQLMRYQKPALFAIEDPTPAENPALVELEDPTPADKSALFEIEDPTPAEVPVADTHAADIDASDTHAADIDAADTHSADIDAADTHAAGIHDVPSFLNAENHATDYLTASKVQATTEVHATDAHATGSPGGEKPQRAMDEDKMDVSGEMEPEKQQEVVSNIEVIPGMEPLKENATTVEEGKPHWLARDGNDVPLPCLQRCSSTVVPCMDIEEGIKEEPEIADKERHEVEFTSKFPNLDGSTDLLQSMDDPFFSSTQQGLGSSCGEFLAPRHDTQTTMSLDCGRAASPLFHDTGKRVRAEIEDEDEEEGGIHQYSSEFPNKRMRTEQPWDNTPSSYNFYFEQAFSSLTKMKMAHEQNHQELVNAQIQIHYLNTALQQKDHYIQSLDRSMMEEQQKQKVHFHHLEYEHNVMSRLVVGYQKALKETRQAFAAYRKRFPQGEEPLYKDAGGPGGMVLTTRELERQHIEKLELEKLQLQRRELDNQLVINTVLRFSREWSSRFENYLDKVQRFGERLNQIKEKINLRSETDVKTKPSPQVSE